MQFTSEHKEIGNTARKFFENEINPFVDEWEEARQFPSHEVFKKLGDLGLLGINKPEAVGGLGLDWSYELAFVEELGHIDCGAIPMAIGVQTDMATPALARFGSDELKAEFLAPAVAGDQVACIGVSEPHAGSDVAQIKTTAKKDGDDYVINGTKMWITNGMKGDWICLLANTSDGAKHANKSLIVVPLDTPGVERAHKLHKLGMWSSDTAQLFFDNVRVPQRNLIGQEGAGFMYQMLQFQEERLFAAASGLKGMEKLIDATIDYTRERKTFGQPLINNQVIHFRMAELKTEVEMLRSAVYRATDALVQGEDATMLCSMAKLKAGRLAREVADACIQYWGGQGYMWESAPARQLRDSRLASIGGGADEIMLGIICKILGILPGKNKGGEA